MRLALVTFLYFIIFSYSNAQPPKGYYSPAGNKYCSALKTSLKQVLNATIGTKTYNNLWTQYPISDIKLRTVGTGSPYVIDDIYSSIPSGTDPYQFIPNINQCGTYSAENGCYNREHSIPLSWFNGNTSINGAATDYNFIFPTDGYVNGKRANFPYGEVANASYTSLNGSKLGNSAIAGFTGNVFEPIDDFKGDVARAFLYFVTMYEDNIATWSANADAKQAFDNSSFPSVKLPYLQLMLKWHNQDPVSQKEIDRNNGAYSYQNNRNPFIDSPLYVNRIWNNICPGLGSLPVVFQLFSGKLNGNTVLLQWTVANQINVAKYEVQKSTDGVNYHTIETQSADDVSQYKCTDWSIYNDATERIFYRIKEIDRSGKFAYSEVWSIRLPDKLKATVYPNPAKDNINIALYNTNAEAISVILTDITGRNIMNNTINPTNGTLQIPTSKIGNGCYFLSIQQGIHLFQHKVIVAK